MIVTHNMQQAARVSEDTAFFNIAGAGMPGKLIEMNSTKKIFSVPTSPPPGYISAASAEASPGLRAWVATGGSGMRRSQPRRMRACYFNPGEHSPCLVKAPT